MAVQTSARRVSAGGHIRRNLVRAVRSIFLAGLVCAVIGAALTEAIAWYLTGAVPTLPTHIAAIVIALSVGYGAAVTAALRAVFRIMVGSMEWVADEVEQIAGRTVHEAETLVGVAPAHQSLTPAPSTSGPSTDWSTGGLAGRIIGGITEEPPAQHQ